MNLLILSRSPDAYFARRMIEAAVSCGIHVQVVNPSDLILTEKDVLFRNESLASFHCCILRSSPYREDKDFSHQAAGMLESKGVKVINSPSAVDVAGNKILTKRKLQDAGIPILKWSAIRSIANLDFAVESVGGYPVFMKTFFGTRGIGVVFCPCRETLRAAAQTMWAYYANIFVEEYAKKSEGRTVRVLVCGNDVIGAIANFPEKLGENYDNHRLIRSNFSRGGKVEKYHLTGDLEKMAISACRATGIFFGGVDLIETDRGWAVLEINSSPGIKGFEFASGIDAAREILGRLFPY